MWAPARFGVLLLLGTACAAQAAAPERGDGGPLAVATTTVLGDLTRDLVGDAGAVDVLIGPGVDPHDFSLSAAQAEALRAADLVVANGLGLEEGMHDALENAAADGANVLEVAGELEPLPFAAADHDGSDEEDGPGHGDLDPHVWQDPRRMADGVRLIAARLAETDDTLADAEWERRGQALADELLAVDAEVEALLAGIPPPRRVLVTNHDAFGYFADRYDFEVVATVIPGGGSLAEPSPTDLEAVVAALQEHDLGAIFAETTAPTALAETVAAEVGRDVEVVELVSDALDDEGTGAGTYAGMIRTNAERIAAALA